MMAAVADGSFSTFSTKTAGSPMFPQVPKSGRSPPLAEPPVTRDGICEEPGKVQRDHGLAKGRRWWSSGGALPCELRQAPRSSITRLAGSTGE